MVDPRTLVIGNTYFTVFYADQGCRVPVVETYVYLGSEQREHVFQTARSFHQRGNWNEMTEVERAAFDPAPVLTFDPESLEPVVDISGLVGEMSDTIARLK